jgi:predicted nucleic acid-binding protein
MMKSIFADTGYWIALLNPLDQLHARSKAVSNQLGRVRIVTSEMVLTEVLNGFAEKGAALRTAAVSLVRELQDNPNVVISPQTSMLFRDALVLYDNRRDKSWSLTDCASILISQSEQITDALSYDEHFQQAGLNPLLRDNTQ